MHITCERCSASFDLELPPSALAPGRSLRFRCTVCGHGFRVVKDGVLVAAAPPGRPLPGAPAEVEAPPLAPGQAVRPPIGAMLLRQEGAAYHIPDMATLQRWVAERRVSAEDELDVGDGRVVRAAELPELSIFFALVRQVEAGGEPSEAAPPWAAAVGTGAQAGPEAEASAAAEAEGAAEAAEGEAEGAPAAEGPGPGGSSEGDSAPWEIPAWADGAAEDPPEPASMRIAPTSADDAEAGWSPPGWAEAAQPERAAPAAGGWSPPSWADEPKPAPPAPKPEVAAPPAGGWSPPSWAAEPKPDAAPPEAGGWSPPSWAGGEPSASDEPLPEAAAGWSPPSWMTEGPAAPTPSADAAPPAAAAGWSPPSWTTEAPAAAEEPKGRDASAALQVDGELGGWFDSDGFDDLEGASPEPPAALTEAPWDVPAPEVKAPPAAVAPAADRAGSSLPDEEPEPSRAGRGARAAPEAPSNNGRMFLMILLVASAAGLGWWWWSHKAPVPLPPAPAPVVVAPAAPVAHPGTGDLPIEPLAPVPAPSPAPAAPPVPDAPAPVGPSPAPKVAPAAPAPAPAPPSPSPTDTKVLGVQGLIKEGWRLADRRQWEKAEAEFRRAVDLKGNSGPAHYGLGYVLSKQSKVDAAQRSLCKAQLFAGSDAALRREISAQLSAIQRECE